MFNEHEFGCLVEIHLKLDKFFYVNPICIYVKENLKHNNVLISLQLINILIILNIQIKFIYVCKVES